MLLRLMISLGVYDTVTLADAVEWPASKRATRSEGYAAEILRCFENDVFPYIGNRPADRIAPSELLAVLQKIEKRGALE